MTVLSPALLVPIAFALFDRHRPKPVRPPRLITGARDRTKGQDKGTGRSAGPPPGAAPSYTDEREELRRRGKREDRHAAWSTSEN